MIKPVGVESIAIIRHIAMITWPATYGRILSAGQVEYMLSKMYSRDTLYRQMANGEQQFLLAFMQGEPIAFASFGAESVSPIVYKLHKLYVSPLVQRSGTGSKLLAAVETRSTAAGAGQLILNVNRGNNAVGFYTRSGFRVLEKIDLDIGNGFLMIDYIMGKSLGG